MTQSTQSSHRYRALAALGHRDFRRFWFGQVVSLVGGWMHQTAMAWLVWRLTHDAALLGVMGFVGNVPVLLLGFPAGAMVDRFERRRLVLIAQSFEMVLALFTAWLAWSGHVQVWHLVVIAGLFGTSTAIEVPARQTLLMDLVGREHLLSAIALNSASFSTSRVIGPALAGLLLSRITEAGCFLINGLSFLGALLALASMKPAGGAGGRMAAAYAPWDGLRYVRRRPEMVALIAQVGAANLFGLPYTQFLPVFVGGVLGLREDTLGMFQASVGCGALLAVLVAASRDPSTLTPRLASRGFLGFAVALCLFALYPGYLRGCLLLMVIGFCGSTQMATTNNYLQTQAPEALRGRVVALYTTTFIGLFPLGCLALGQVARRAGVQLTVACGAIVCAMIATALLHRLPAVVPPPEITAPDDAAD